MSDANDANDDLQDLLGPRPGSPSAAFRDRLFQQTRARLVLRRRRRWLTRAASLAAVFTLGGATGWLARPAPAPVSIPSPQTEVVTVVVPVPVPIAIPGAGSAAEVLPAATAALTSPEIELQAEQADGPQAATLYKSAGDAFLSDEDYANATRCYRLYLARAGDAALSLGPDDSWLLTSLKNAAFQEKSRVQKTD